MNAGFIVAYVFLFLLVVGGGIYIYSYYIYSKNIMFNKPKHSIATLVLYIILCVFLIVMGALYLTIWKNKELPNYKIHAAISFVLADIYLIYFLLNILIVKSNQEKIDYKQYQQIDFKTMFAEYKAKIGDLESLKSFVSKRHKKYYEKMMDKYMELLTKAKDQSIPTATKVADIVVFNDVFTNKWSDKANKFHKLLVLQFLALL